MNKQAAKVHCDECGNWVTIGPDEERARCECGHQFVVTVTRIPAQPV
jgi:hypothetical protein